ncbi:nucleotidyltransferase [Salinicoccus carnicancri]|uniref:nucleotidyltransferase n=1 Tax=Salinicoccus carnicancri TaxID=558170 RepID=UPI00031BC353|nr:nucleotidyltransferase [Salinicoccus carnicancri]
MIITSLITEYNPFHNGHIHHIEASRRLTGADVVIAIMSGNFTQRGEIAITDKFTRAEAAVKHVDLVVELPLYNAVSYADDFALGGVHAAALLQSTHIVFGSESGDIEDLKDIHTRLRSSDIKRTMTALMKEGYSYPRAVDKAIGSDLFSGSNNILGLSYIGAIDALGADIEPLTIPRLGNRFDDENLSESRFSSATSLRKALMENRLTEAARYMPKTLAGEIANGTPLSNADIFDSLKIIISRMSHMELRGIYMMTEGLEHRIKDRVRHHNSYDSFINDVKTKRYTRTRLNRLMISILLNITKDKMKDYVLPDAVRVLAMNRTGQEYLRQLPEDLEIITNVNSKNRNSVMPEIAATDIYNVFSGSDRNDFNTPVIIAGRTSP